VKVGPAWHNVICTAIAPMEHVFVRRDGRVPIVTLQLASRIAVATGNAFTWTVSNLSRASIVSVLRAILLWIAPSRYAH